MSLKASETPIDEALLSQQIRDPDVSEAGIKTKEAAILRLGEYFARAGRLQDLSQLLTDIRPLFQHFPKAKTAKVVRTLIDHSALIPNSTEFQTQLCEDSIQWCRVEKRTFLKQRLETKLLALYLKSGRFPEAQELNAQLLVEVKKLDDKLQLVEIQLLESKLYHRLKNLPRAKAALTASRTCANAIYCPPQLQAEIDIMSGILHCEEKDYKTGYSYFYEAHEGLNSIGDPEAMQPLLYMLLCKVMSQRPEDVQALIVTKAGVKFVGRQIDALKALAIALKLRSLHEFQKVLAEYSEVIQADQVISTHVTMLYDTMLEQHLCRIIEPFSKVEISHIAELIGLREDVVLQKLSQMILDQHFEGTLDQGSGCLILFDDVNTNQIYDTSMKNIKALSDVVDSLFEKALVAKDS